MIKKTERGKCPFNKLNLCNKECVLFRSGFRYKEDGTDPIPFEDCAINIGVDCLENLVSRNIGIQKESNKVANNIDELSKITGDGTTWTFPWNLIP